MSTVSNVSRTVKLPKIEDSSMSDILKSTKPKSSKMALKKSLSTSKFGKSAVIQRKGEDTKKKSYIKRTVNFFDEVKTDKSKVNQFMAQSAILEKNKGDYISKLLDKSKLSEERLQANVLDAKLRERFLHNKNTKSLMELRSRMEHHTDEELAIIKRKKRELVVELNKVCDSIRRKKREILRLKNCLENLRTPDTKQYDVFLKERGELRSKAQSYHEVLMKQKRFKNRMLRIKELCEMNQLQNEEWIRKLTYYQNNINKAIDMQNAKIEKIELERFHIAEKSQQLIEEYNIRLNEHQELIKGIQDEVERKKFLDRHIAATNFLVNESILMKKDEIKQDMEDHLAKERREKEMKENQRREQKMRDELEELKEVSERVNILFDTEGEEDWSERPEMKKTVVEIERKKDLERFILEKKLRLEKVEEDNLFLQDELRTLREANKGVNNDMYQTEKIRERFESVKMKRIAVENQIEESEEKVRSSLKITNQTNLIVSSIARKLGLANSIYKENEILNDEDILKTVKSTFSGFLKQIFF